MRRIICEVFHPQRATALTRIALVMAAWWIVQNLSSLLIIRLFGLPAQISSIAWHGLDRMAPIPQAVTSFSFLLSVPSMKLPEILMHLTVAFVQLAIFTCAAWIVVKQVFEAFGGVPWDASFKRHVAVSLSLVPVLVSLSFVLTQLTQLLQALKLPAFYANLASWAFPDALALLLFFVFMPSFLFAQKGLGVIKSLAESLFSTAKWMWHLSALALATSLLVCGISSSVYEPAFVSSGLFEPLRQVVTLAGWMMTSAIWIFTGFVYDRHVSDKLRYEL